MRAWDAPPEDPERLSAPRSCGDRMERQQQDADERGSAQDAPRAARGHPLVHRSASDAAQAAGSPRRTGLVRRSLNLLRRVLITLRQAGRLDQLERRQTHRAWEDWAEVRPDERDATEDAAVRRDEGDAKGR